MKKACSFCGRTESEVKLLITGLSSFSYDPGLINPAKKIAPKKFWNPYPKNGEWILADEEGNIEEDYTVG